VFSRDRASGSHWILSPLSNRSTLPLFPNAELYPCNLIFLKSCGLSIVDQHHVFQSLKQSLSGLFSSSIFPCCPAYLPIGIPISFQVRRPNFFLFSPFDSSLEEDVHYFLYWVFFPSTIWSSWLQITPSPPLHPVVRFLPPFSFPPHPLLPPFSLYPLPFFSPFSPPLPFHFYPPPLPKNLLPLSARTNTARFQLGVSRGLFRNPSVPRGLCCLFSLLT